MAQVDKIAYGRGIFFSDANGRVAALAPVLHGCLPVALPILLDALPRPIFLRKTGPKMHALQDTLVQDDVRQAIIVVNDVASTQVKWEPPRGIWGDPGVSWAYGPGRQNRVWSSKPAWTTIGDFGDLGVS